MPSPYTKKYPNGRHQTVTCLICGRLFDIPDRSIRRGDGKYCGIACKAVSQKKTVAATCQLCGRPIEARPSEIKKGLKYCSWECRKIGIRGAGHPQWSDDPDYRGWDWEAARQAAMERDGHRCRRCSSETSLLVHHITPWKDTQDNSPINLLTLCISCHNREHRNLNSRETSTAAIS